MHCCNIRTPSAANRCLELIKWNHSKGISFRHLGKQSFSYMYSVYLEMGKLAYIYFGTTRSIEQITCGCYQNNPIYAVKVCCLFACHSLEPISWLYFLIIVIVVFTFTFNYLFKKLFSLSPLLIFFKMHWFWQFWKKIMALLQLVICCPALNVVVFFGQTFRQIQRHFLVRVIWPAIMHSWHGHYHMYIGFKELEIMCSVWALLAGRLQASLISVDSANPLVQFFAIQDGKWFSSIKDSNI